MKKVIATAKAPGAIGPYSQAIDTGSFVYASGQIPIDPATGNIPQGIEAQSEQAMRNVEAILAEAGLTTDNVVKTTVFLSDMGIGVRGGLNDFNDPDRPKKHSQIPPAAPTYLRCRLL